MKVPKPHIKGYTILFQYLLFILFTFEGCKSQPPKIKERELKDTFLKDTFLKEPESIQERNKEEPKVDCKIPELIQKVNPQNIEKYIKKLTSLERSSWQQQKETADYLFNLLKGFKIEVRHEEYLDRRFTYSNIVAELPGLEGKELFLFGAHYDSVPGSPGADDNASGVAALLEMSRILSSCKFKKGLRIVFFSNEERKLLGSRHHAKSAKKRGDMIRGMIAIDSIGYAPSLPEDLDVATKPEQAWLANKIEEATHKYTPLKVFKIIDKQCG
jgi:hypothetical protein